MLKNKIIRAYFRFYRLKAVRDLVNRNTIDVNRTGRSLLSASMRKNMRVFVTTILRKSQDKDFTGYLYELDWHTQSIRKQIPLPIDPSVPYWNPRGGNRGGRGMATHSGILYVGVAERILKFSKELELIGDIVHPYFGSLHAMVSDDDGLWVTSGLHDLVLKISYKGEILDEWWGHESNYLRKKFGLRRRILNIGLKFPEDKFMECYAKYAGEELFHINSLSKVGENVYVYLPTVRSHVRIRPLPEKIILFDPSITMGHDGTITPDNRAIINDTHYQTIRIYDLDTKKRRIKTLGTKLIEVDGPSTQFASGGWQRGLSHVSADIYLAGTSPATVFEIDVANDKMGTVMRIDSNPKNSVHNIFVTYDL